MKKDHEGVTTNKSNKVMNNAEFINKEMDTIIISGFKRIE